MMNMLKQFLIFLINQNSVNMECSSNYNVINSINPRIIKNILRQYLTQNTSIMDGAGNPRTVQEVLLDESISSEQKAQTLTNIIRKVYNGTINDETVFTSLIAEVQDFLNKLQKVFKKDNILNHEVLHSTFKNTYMISSDSEQKTEEGETERHDETISGTVNEQTYASFKKQMNTLFMKVPASMVSIPNKFKANIVENLFVSLRKDKAFIASTDTFMFNKNLAHYQNDLYKAIVSYLNKNGYKIPSDELYTGQDFILNGTYRSVMEDAYNLIQDKINTKTSNNSNKHIDLLTSGWGSEQVLMYDPFAESSPDYDKNASDYYRFVEAWFTLNYFDDLLSKVFGNTVTLVTKGSKNNLQGSIKPGDNYKYRFGVDRSGRNSGFTDENKRNGFTEAGRFSVALATSLPLYSYSKYVDNINSEDAIEISKQNGRLIDQILINTSFNTLLNLVRDNVIVSEGDKDTRNQRIIDGLNSLINNPKYYIKDVLDALFERTSDIKESVIDNLIRHDNISSREVDTLFSLWKNVYNTENKIGPSIIKLENTLIAKRVINSGDNFVYSDCISGLISRVVELQYLSIDYSKGEMSFRKKFSNDGTLFSIRDQINNSISSEPQYELKELSDGTYSISLGNITLNINPKTKKNSSENLFNTLKNKVTISVNGEEYIPIDDAFKYIKFTSASSLNAIRDVNTNINKVLDFLSKVLHQNLLTDDNLQILHLYKIQHPDSMFEELVAGAARVIYATQATNDFLKNDRYNSLPLYLITSGYSHVFGSIGKEVDGEFKPDTQSAIYKKRIGRLGDSYLLTPVHTDDIWLKHFTDARYSYKEEVPRSTSTNYAGNKEQNGRTAHLGAYVHSYIQDINKEAQVQRDIENGEIEGTQRYVASQHLLMVENPNIFKGAIMSSDVKSKDGKVKAIKAMNTAELLFTNIFHNFYGMYYSDNKSLSGKVAIQPTTYSDKSSIISFLFQADSKVGNYSNLMSLNFNDLINITMNNMGKYYEETALNILSDWSKVLGIKFNTDNIKQSLEKLNSELLKIDGKREFELINIAQSQGVELQRETHYSIFNGKFGVNPLLYNYISTLQNRESVKLFLKSELKNFINDIIDSGLYIDINDDFAQLAISKYFGSVEEAEEQGWIKNGYLVLAKVGKEQIVQGTKITNNSFETNPLLEKYFIVYNTLSPSMRTLLTGSEIAHPLKKSEPYRRSGDLFLKFPDYKVKNIVELAQEIEKRGVKEDIDKYNNLITELRGIAGAEGTQLKRNVIVPATMQLVQQKVLNGIAENIKVAVLDDIKAFVNTFNGKSDDEDAHDGSALINPFFSQLENNSLQDQAPYLDKKPIWHHYDKFLGTATLLKYATFTITNLRMQQSLNSDVSLYQLFKKMTNIQWRKIGKRGDPGDDWNSNTWSNLTKSKIDLVNGRKFGLDGNGNLKTKISLKDVLPNSYDELIYGQGDEYWRIFELNYTLNDEGFENISPIYYTSEQRLNLDGSFNSKRVKVYHLFDENSNHIQLSEQEVKERFNDIKAGKLHTINSLFELHAALGGIFCVKNVNGEFVSSELNNKVIANYMSFVGDAHLVHITDKNIDGTNNTIANNLTQDNYRQPLKELMISVAANTSAVKNGQSNVNQRESWKNGDPLNYMTISSKMYGIQQDSDHEADEAQLTEPTQVMTALSQGGSLHKYARQIYQSVGRVSLLASKVELSAVDDFIKKYAANNPKAINKLYDVVGRIILNQVDSNSNDMDLCDEILEEIRQEFGVTSDDHTLDDLKIAFSDPNLYGKVFPAIISTINSKGIRRKNPGNGMVMAPSYGIYQTYKFGDKRVTFNELIRQIRLERATVNDDKTFANKILSPEAIVEAINQKLNEQQKQQPVFDYNAFDLGDRINIIGNLRKQSELRKLKDASVIWAHPASGKTYLYEHGRKDIIDFDSEYKSRLGDLKARKALKKQIGEEAYNLELDKLFDEAKQEAITLNKKLLVSDIHFLRDRNDDLDVITNMSDEKFIERSKQRGEFDVADKQKWKDSINEVMNTVSDKSKILTTDHYLSYDLIDPTVSIYIDSIEKFYLIENRNWAKLANNKTLNDYISRYKDLTNLNLDKILKEKGLSGFLKERYELNPNDKIILDTIAKDKLLKLYDYETLNYQEDVTKGIDLLPTRIQFTENGIKRSIYHIPMIQKAFKSGEQINTFVMKELFTDLKHGQYYDNYKLVEIPNGDGTSRKEVQKSGINHSISNLIHQKPQAIVSNMWATRFNTSGDKTLNQVMNDVMIDTEKYLNDNKNPLNNKVELTFLKGNGKHTLISFSDIIPYSDNQRDSKYEKIIERHTRKNLDSKNGLYIYDVISLNSDNSDSTIIERQVERPDLKVNKIGEIIDKSGKPVDNTDNKYISITINGVTKVFEKFQYLNEYLLKQRKPGSRDFQDYTIYSINKELIDKMCELTKEDSTEFISNLTAELYNKDSYIGFIPSVKDSSLLGKVGENKENGILPKLAQNEELRDYCVAIQENKNVEASLMNLLETYKQELNTSFLKSLEIIGSRIPAQTLQSFMSMEIVDYTQMETNVAYVSSIQTFLQGSDYDIDKCYMISYFFDDNGKFIKWSPLISLNNIEELNNSTRLPIPNGTHILSANDINFKSDDPDFKQNYTRDITDNLIAILSAKDNSQKISAYADLIDYLDSNAGIAKFKPKDGELESQESPIIFYEYNEDRLINAINLIYNSVNSSPEIVKEKVKQILSVVDKHEQYNIPEVFKERALQNANSAKIHIIINDFSNINAANTPINMKDAQKATDRRQGQTKVMNLWNPAVSSKMQVENQTGRNVIGIAANGEKAFFTLYYYFTESYRKLKDGLFDPQLARFLSFKKQFSRIEGRWNADDPKLNNPSEKLSKLKLSTKTKIANLNFELTGQSNDIDFEVDQMISQLLSAATDNAKELILAKINANADLAKIFFYGLILGFDIKDLTAFMTSPAVDLLVELSHGNVFDPKSNLNISKVLKMVTEGKYPVREYLGNSNYSKLNKVLRETNNEYKTIESWLLAKNEGKIKESFLDFVKRFHGYHNEETGTSFYYNDNNKLGISQLSEYIDGTSKKVMQIKQLYKTLYGSIEEFDNDLKEFKTLWDMANEVTSLTNVFLSTNQGLPTTFDKYISRNIAIERVVKSRESEISMPGNNDGEVVTISSILASKESEEDKISNLAKLVTYINPQYDGQESYLYEVLKDALSKDIIGNFNLNKWLSDKSYRDTVTKYYDTIKGTFNVFHFLESHPQYNANMELFRVSSVMVMNTNLKTKLLFKSIRSLMGDSTYWDSTKNKKVQDAVGEIITRQFLNDSDIELELSPDWKIFNSQWELDESIPLPLKFKTGLDYSNFKYVVENYILPKLKDGSLTVNKGNKQQDISDNAFIKGLEQVVKFNRPYLALDIDMGTREVSASTNIKYNQYSQGFKELKSYTLPGFKIAGKDATVQDLFVLYNIIVNQNKYGSDKFTSIFKSSINRKDTNSILYKYYKYVGNSDQKSYTYEDGFIDKMVKDILIKMAPTISKSQLPYYDGYVKIRENGLIKLYYNGEQAAAYVIDPEGESAVPTTEQNINVMKYACLFSQNDSTEAFLNKLDTTKPKQLLEIVRDLISTNKLLISYNC